MDKKRMASMGKRLAAVVLAGGMLLSATQIIDVKAATLKDIFDEHYYADTYKDLKDAYGYDREALWSHYVQNGLAENRPMNKLFDVVKYKKMYADLSAAFGDNWNAYINHYLTVGMKEGRENGTDNDFNAYDYAARYQDLQTAYGDDVLGLWKHYQEVGAEEGRESRSEEVVAAEEEATRREEEEREAEEARREEESSSTATATPAPTATPEPSAPVKAATPIYTDEAALPIGWIVGTGSAQGVNTDKGGNTSNKLALTGTTKADYRLASAVSAGHVKLEYEVFNDGIANAMVIYDNNGKALINVSGAKSGNINIMPGYPDGAASGADYATSGSIFEWVGLGKAAWIKVSIDIDLDKSNQDKVLSFTLNFYEPDGDYKGADTEWKLFAVQDVTNGQERDGQFSQAAYTNPRGNNKGGNIVSAGSHANGAATPGITSFNVAGIQLYSTGDGLYYDNMVLTEEPSSTATATPAPTATPEPSAPVKAATPIYTDEATFPTGWIVGTGSAQGVNTDKGGNTSNKLALAGNTKADYRLASVASTGHVKLEYEVFNDGVLNTMVIYDRNGVPLINVQGAPSGYINIMPGYPDGAASGADYATSGQIFEWVGNGKAAWRKVSIDIDLDKSNQDKVLNFTLNFYEPDGDYKGADTEWKLFAVQDVTNGQERDGQFSQAAYTNPRGNNKGGNIVSAGSHANGAATPGITSFNVAGIQLYTTGEGLYYDNMVLTVE